MTNYDKGARLEYKARDALSERGYTVIRSAGSHGAADLVALKADDVVLVQVGKRGKSVAAAARLLAAVAAPGNVRREVWVWVPRKGWRIAAVSQEIS